MFYSGKIESDLSLGRIEDSNTLPSENSQKISLLAVQRECLWVGFLGYLVVRKTASLSTGDPCFKIGGPSLGVLQF